MKPEEVIGISKGVIEPITEKLFAAIKSLPTKDDIKNIISDLESRFRDDLKERDKKIFELESRVSDLEELRHSDTDKLIVLSQKITELESRFESTANVNDSVGDGDIGDVSKEDLELVVLGDSIVRLVNPDCNQDPLDLDQLNVNKVESVSGGKIQDMYENIEKLNDTYNIKNLILHIGSNHIPEMSPMSVSYGIIKLIDDIRDLMPHTKIFFSAILPKESIYFNPGINAINRHLYDVSTIMNFDFIIHSTFCSHSIVTERFYKYDRIHLSPSGISQLERDFVKALRQ